MDSLQEHADDHTKHDYIHVTRTDLGSLRARIAALEEALRDLVAAGRALGPWLLKSRPADGFPIQIATDYADALIAAERLSNTASEGQK